MRGALSLGQGVLGGSAFLCCLAGCGARSCAAFGCGSSRVAASGGQGGIGGLRVPPTPSLDSLLTPLYRRRSARGLEAAGRGVLVRRAGVVSKGLGGYCVFRCFTWLALSPARHLAAFRRNAGSAQSRSSKRPLRFKISLNAPARRMSFRAGAMRLSLRGAPQHAALAPPRSICAPCSAAPAHGTRLSPAAAPRAWAYRREAESSSRRNDSRAAAPKRP